MWQLHVDTGGTFTDCIAYAPNGTSKRLKILSNASIRAMVKEVQKNKVILHHAWEFDLSILKGYQIKKLESEVSYKIEQSNKDPNVLLSEAPDFDSGDTITITAEEEVPVMAARLLTETPLNVPLPPIFLKLGSTKGTNALLEGKGARTLLITTVGFADLPKIKDQRRPDLFSLVVEKPASLLHSTVTVKEQIDAKGICKLPLDTSVFPSIIKAIKENQIESIAICLLNSYQNDAHEQQIASFLKENGVAHISVSTALSNNIGFLERMETTIVNAYLKPIIAKYIGNIKEGIGNTPFKVMNSAGGLVDVRLFEPKDGLLSGPAGGIVGAALKAEEAGYKSILTFDMGGTSTDVGLYRGQHEYRYRQTVGAATIQAPGLAIETIASGGGSICAYHEGRLLVGPESAGAHPGPACYGAGGPLTLTDINLLLGKIDPKGLGIPLNLKRAQKALDSIRLKIQEDSGVIPEVQHLLEDFEQIANEQMARAVGNMAIQKGRETANHALLSFGGAGGQHACQIATILNVNTVLVPYDAGLLSAYGIGHSRVEQMVSKQILQPIEAVAPLPSLVAALHKQGKNTLVEEGYDPSSIKNGKVFLYLRLIGQDNALEIPYLPGINLEEVFKEHYASFYGHWIENIRIELESIKALVYIAPESLEQTQPDTIRYSPEPSGTAFHSKYQKDIFSYQWESLQTGAVLSGPAILYSQNATTMIEKGWECVLNQHNTAVLSLLKAEKGHGITLAATSLALGINRLKSIAEDMGTMLQRASFSVNVKERMDFSCAVLDANGALVVNAPHIPVHLGSLGICVRKVIATLSLKKGDVAITNHPGYGGSHLPDVTLIKPVYVGSTLVAYVANRAHHAEIGGKRPGSMPPDATCLEEEGVVIAPQLLVKSGKPQWEKIEKLLLHGAWPTRALEENMADLKGALASLQLGQQRIEQLVAEQGLTVVVDNLEAIQAYSAKLLQKKLSELEFPVYKATEYLDNGKPIHVQIQKRQSKLEFDFSGSGSVNQNNLNATEAIVTSVVLYVLRLLVDEAIPLNEGLLRAIVLVLPEGFLNPVFSADNTKSPAVVGGNTEISQRLTDTLLKAFGMAACSQGTMNNLVFGNRHFGYYETLAGGVGATKGHHGASAVHQHMTNTKITDPEIMALRYPVNIKEFKVRTNSGGKGQWCGGDGLVRSYLFLEPVQVSILAEHRREAPYGLEGGGEGVRGNQYLIDKKGVVHPLKGMAAVEVEAGETLVMETPGGGAYGSL